MPHLNNKQNKNTDPVISRQDYHLTQPCPSEEEQTKTQHKSHPIQAHTNHWTNLQFSSVQSLSCVRLFVTLWTVAHQAPPSMAFSRQEYWSESPFPSPGDLPNPGIKPRSPVLQVASLPAEPKGKPRQMAVTKSGK